MPIAKGEEWGRPGSLPSDAPVASSDADAASLIEAAPTSEARVIGLDDGDLARTLGIRKPYDRAAPKQLLPVDAVEVELDDGVTRRCIAHVVVGSLVFNRVSVAVMNAAFIGHHNVAPRAHPGDGVVDVVTFNLGPTDRFKARRRMVTASHLPHPGIRVSRRHEGVIELPRAQPVRIDGQPCGRSATVRYRVVSEAIVIAVS